MAGISAEKKEKKRTSPTHTHTIHYPPPPLPTGGFLFSDLCRRGKRGVGRPMEGRWEPGYSFILVPLLKFIQTPPQRRQWWRWAPECHREQSQCLTTMMTGPMPHRNGTTQYPPHAVYHRCLTMTPVPRSPAPRHNHPTYAPFYINAPFVERWEVAQILQRRGY